MKKLGTTIMAIFVGFLQVVAFYGLMPVFVVQTMWSWRTWRVWRVTKFNVCAAAHKIRYDFKEWYR
jgi:hypothetical protein